MSVIGAICMIGAALALTVRAALFVIAVATDFQMRR